MILANFPYSPSMPDEFWVKIKRTSVINPNHPLNGKPGECNRYGDQPCCNRGDYCSTMCQCFPFHPDSPCIDYKQVYKCEFLS